MQKEKEKGKREGERDIGKENAERKEKRGRKYDIKGNCREGKKRKRERERDIGKVNAEKDKRSGKKGCHKW